MKTTEYKRLDSNPGALVNIDSNALAAYKLKKKQNAQVIDLNNRINNLESKLDKLLEAINGITNNTNN